MRITNIRCEVYKGTADYQGQYFEHRLARPTDMYEEFRKVEWGRDDNLPWELEPGKLAITGRFLYIDTDEGLSGMFGPIAPGPALMAMQMKGLLAGQDALATTKLWDVMHRAAIHGRKGVPMMAISAVDCALWDLKGKAFGQPVCRLLGGPTRDKLPVYVSTLTYSVDPDKATAQAKKFKAQGYKGQKWFFRHGPGSGEAGFEANMALVKAVREAVGEDYDLMFDAWNSWDILYTLRFARAAEKYRIRWIEEPIMPDKIDQMAQIAAASPVPIAGAEHEYTRWGFNEVLSKKAAHFIQPDPMWAGGITETVNICTLASVHGVPAIPHGESIAAAVHVIASQAPDVCPQVENLEKFNIGWQHFLKDPVRCVDGFITHDMRPGLGLVLDEGKIQEKSDMKLPE
jgi:L-alanine-DL-glutamate epimerase-like enolase superfamily enzyme